MANKLNQVKLNQKFEIVGDYNIMMPSVSIFVWNKSTKAADSRYNNTYVSTVYLLFIIIQYINTNVHLQPRMHRFIVKSQKLVASIIY